jgi:hypothetical protein
MTGDPQVKPGTGPFDLASMAGDRPAFKNYQAAVRDHNA